MRFALLCIVALPVMLSAQAFPTRTRTSATPLPIMQPSASTDPTIATLDANAPRTDDMPAPTVQLTYASPTSATLSWNAIVGASGYVVYRNDLGALNSPPLPLTTTSFTHRAANDYRVTYTYRVVAQYPNAHTGPSAPVSFTPPKAPPLGEFDVGLEGNSIVFTWSPSGPFDPDYVMLFGPGLGTGVKVPGTKRTYTLDNSKIADERLGGTLQYAAAAYFEPGPVTAPASEWRHESVHYARGRYRFTITGFRALQATERGSQSDGNGDEIFLAASIRQYERSTQTVVASTGARTRVYGDARRFAGRIKAGSMPGGGIQDGDEVWVSTAPPGIPADSALPLRIWEGELFPDDVLVIRPAVFELDLEHDPNENCYLEWRQLFAQRANFASQSSVGWQVTHELLVPKVGQDLNNLERGGTLTDINAYCYHTAQNQTVGLDRVITFTVVKLERFLAYGLAPEFALKDSEGAYLVRMTIERVQDPVPAVPVIAP
jgi:hypothetical protein